MDDLTNLSISKAITLLKKKEISVTELINAHIAAMESSRELNAFITETADLARNAASISDKNYEIFGLDLYESLMKSGPSNFILYYLCLS